jgi:hypothetical protein
MANRRRIGGNRRGRSYRHRPEMAVFCASDAYFRIVRHLLGIGGESARRLHLTGAAPNGTLPSASVSGSVTPIRPVARYAPLRLRAANSLASLSNLPLSPPCADSKSNWRAIGAIGGGRSAACRATPTRSPS